MRDFFCLVTLVLSVRFRLLYMSISRRGNLYCIKAAAMEIYLHPWQLFLGFPTIEKTIYVQQLLLALVLDLSLEGAAEIKQTVI